MDAKCIPWQAYEYQIIGSRDLGWPRRYINESVNVIKFNGRCHDYVGKTVLNSYLSPGFKCLIMGLALKCQDGSQKFPVWFALTKHEFIWTQWTCIFWISRIKYLKEKREKFSSGLGFEPRYPALRSNQMSYPEDSLVKLELSIIRSPLTSGSALVPSISDGGEDLCWHYFK